ncbi:unnamed protein product [Ambrosiozyma monospora]|uniref:Protein PNS1 n=1 Tax=Ambrosiozyma monospora TaxID=43982 RepID=A0A9W6YVT5_AMBMO|nr:unnamed protein product [Ambrosiozyma monospora]
MSYNRPSDPPPQQPYQQQQQPQYSAASTDLEQGYGSDQKYSQNEKFNQQYAYDRPPEPIPGQQTFEESFKIEKPKWNDWPFTLLFLATVAGFIVVAALSLKEYAHTYSYQGASIYNNTNSFSLNTNTTILFVFVIVLGLVLAALVLGIARVWPRQFITIGIICNVILGLGTSIMYLVLGYYSAGIVFLVFTVISAWCYWSCRSRIPFSANVLTIAIDVMKAYPSTIVISFIGFVVMGAFSFLFTTTITASYMKWGDETRNSSNNAKLTGLLVFIFFAGYYITEVLRNIIHVTVSGIFGTWYYLSKSDQGVPKHQAWGAFKRAMTYCFGSICFGSLIVTFIQLLKQFIQILRQNAMGNGELCETILFFCLECFISIIEWMVLMLWSMIV